MQLLLRQLLDERGLCQNLRARASSLRSTGIEVRILLKKIVRFSNLEKIKMMK